MSETKPSISVVVPVYRSGRALDPLYQRCRTVLDHIAREWELILVDDASPDDSWSAATELRALDTRVRIVRLAHNHGQQAATLCGLGYARFDYIFTMDDDLQFSPEDMPAFVEALRSGKQVAIGRIGDGKKRHAGWRNLGSRIYQTLAGRILGKPKGLRLSSYRAMTRKIARKLVRYQGAHTHIAALILRTVPATAICNVPVQHAGRQDGQKGFYTLPKLIKTLSFLLINHSYLPLRLMIFWGILVSIASLAYATWILLRGFGGYTVPGWASLAVLISFLCGNILLALGVVGEYLGRLVEEVSRITQFSVFDEQT